MLPRHLTVFALCTLLSLGACSTGTGDIQTVDTRSDATQSYDDVGHDAWAEADISSVEPDAPIDAAHDATSDAGDTDFPDDVFQPPPPNFEVFFTDPPDADTRDLVLEQTLRGLIEQTPAGASIRVAFFTWSRTGLARAFADALDRGADVRIVLGNTNRRADGTDWEAVVILKDRLGDRLTICSEGEESGACHGTGINHNKFVLFSELDDGSTNVVFQSSANLTRPQLLEFNNAVIIRNDLTLYNAYHSYWEDLDRDQTDLDYYHSVVGDLRTKAYFYPRESGDTIVGILDNVHCDVGARIRISMAYFTNARIEIARSLRQMAIDGCDVALNLRAGDLLGSNVVTELDHDAIDRVVYPEDHHPNVHSKYLLIDGAYGANASQQRIVWTGSHNYTGTALRSNDETLLKIRDDAVFEAFDQDWQRIHDRAP